MNHFKTEIILNEFIENFNKDKMKIEFTEIHLYNVDDNKRVIIKDRRYNIIYKSLSFPISFNLFILNNLEIKNERIDILIEEGYDIEEIMLDIYYDDIYIEDYVFKKDIGEQVDLIKFIEEKNIFDITNNPYLTIDSINGDLELLFLPINDENYPVKRKLVSKMSDLTYGFKYVENKIAVFINDKSLLDSFDNIEVLISSKNTIIAPKDLDSLEIIISNLLRVNFSNSNNVKITKAVSIDPFGTINLNYKSPYFKTTNIRTVSLGHLFKIENRIYFKYKICYYKEPREAFLSKIKEIY